MRCITGLAAAFLTLALATPTVPSLAAQGKAKGHVKHADKAGKGDKENNKHKNKPKHKAAKQAPAGRRIVGTSGQRMRFAGLDVNNDGVITRNEWRGNDVSFRNHDWNGDGVLSGDEVRPGARRPGTVRRVPPAPRPGSDPDEVLFARQDVNRDGVLTRAEFHGSDADFARLDFDKNGVLSPYEFGVGR